jgi:hypothetical protein
VGAAAGEALQGKVRSGNIVTVPASETVSSDLYIASGTTRVDGRVEGDLVVAGGTVDVTGTVTGGILATGGTLTINGPTGGSIRAAGGTIVVGGTVGRDVVVAGGTFNLARTAHVTGDTVFGGGKLTIDGTVDGNVLGSASAYTMNGTVKGTQNVTIQQRRQPKAQPWGPLAGLRPYVVHYVGIVLFGLLMLWLLPRGVEAVARRARTRPLPSLGVGLLGLLGVIAVPIGIIILMLVLAIPLGLLGFGLLSGFTIFAGLVAIALFAFAVAFLMVFLADAWVGYTFGRLILERTQAAWARQPVWALVIGALIVVLLSAIPIVGGLIGVIVIALALGAVILAVMRRDLPTTAPGADVAVSSGEIPPQPEQPA